MTKSELNGRNHIDEAEDVEKILAVVVKRRKTIPTKCLEFRRRIAAVEMLRLKNSIIAQNENDEKENFKRSIQEIMKTKHPSFSLDDLEGAEIKLQRYFSRLKEINEYLERRKQGK